MNKERGEIELSIILLHSSYNLQSPNLDKNWGNFFFMVLISLRKKKKTQCSRWKGVIGINWQLIFFFIFYLIKIYIHLIKWLMFWLRNEENYLWITPVILSYQGLWNCICILLMKYCSSIFFFFFVKSTCGKQDIVVKTSVRCMWACCACIRMCIHPDLSEQ